MRRARACFIRVASLFNKQRRDRELAEELESHLELHIDDNLRAGMSPVEARRQALIKLGGIEQTKELYRDRRGITLIEGLLKDFRYGLRMLAKRPGFTAVAVLTLALGIGGTTAVFSVVYGAVIDPFPYRDIHRMAMLAVHWPASNATDVAFLSPPEWLDYQQSNHVFDEVMGTAADNVVLTGAAGAKRCWGYRITVNTFRVLGVQPLLGRVFRDEDAKPDAPPVVILSYKAWQSEFGGDPEILGKTVVLNHQAATVVGVTPARFGWAPGYSAELPILWLPATVSRSRGPDPYYNYTVPYYTFIGRLKPGVSIEQAASEIAVLAKQFATVYPKDHPKEETFTVESVTKGLTHGMGNRLLILLGAAGLLLLIACVNVANLLLARATGRQREFAVRASLGASQMRLIRQLMVESLLLALGGVALGCVIAQLATDGLSAIVPHDWINSASAAVSIPSEVVIQLNVPVFFFSLVIALLSALLFGIAPALQTAGANLQEPLKANSRGGGEGRSHGMLRTLLVVSEVAISLVLLTGGGLLMRSFFALEHADLGYNPDKMIMTSAWLPEERYKTAEQRNRFHMEILRRMRAMPGVVSATFGDRMVYGWSAPVQIPGKTSTEQQEAWLWTAGDRFFETLGIRLLRGRPISEDDVLHARKVAVVNRAFANKYFPGENPLGKPVVSVYTENWDQRERFEIVGVAADTRHSDGRELTIEPSIYLPYTLGGVPWNMLQMRTASDPARLVNSVRREFAAVDKDVPVQVQASFRDYLAGYWYSEPRFVLVMLVAFATLGLALVSIGVYGVLSYHVSQRTHEIGVRRALGAQAREVRWMVLKAGLRSLLIGIAIGVPLSIALARILQNKIWGIKDADPLTLVTVSLVLTAVGLAACCIPARRASKVDPMVALRFE